jgi:hypothetical protein
MLTLTAQTLTSLFLLAFGILACLVARRLPVSQPVYRYVWQLTGGVFAIQGLNSLFHDAFSIAAYSAGAQSWAWKAVLAWHPALNHSRTFLLTTYCVILCVVLLRVERGKPLPSLKAALGAAAGGMVVGGVVGWHEVSFSGLTHFTAVAIWDIMELLAMMAVLMVGLSTASIDRRMWACVSINAFALALSVLWFAFLSRIDFAGEWRPRTYQIHLVKAVLYLGMNAIAFAQLRQSRRGAVLRSFFDDRLSRPGVFTLNA